MKLAIDDLADMARGAAFLGAGGGGDPYIGRMLATSAIREFGSPRIIDVEDLGDDSFVCTVAMAGAPTVLSEKAAGGDEVDLVIALMEKYQGRKIDAIVPVEIGGLNSMIPLMAAARSGLPLVDADGMGRAFPEIQMTSFNVYGILPTPVVVADEHLNSLIVESKSAKRAEQLVRLALTEMGCSVLISAYAMSGRDLKRTAIRGTMTMALEIGRTIERSRRGGDPLERLLCYLNSSTYYQPSRVIFSGRVVDLRRETTGGFAVGHCHMDALDGSGRTMKVAFQNENIAAWEDDRLRVIVPDLICLVDSETGEPIPVNALRYGQRIKVLALRAPPILRAAEALTVVGPQAFGLTEPYHPYE